MYLILILGKAMPSDNTGEESNEFSEVVAVNDANYDEIVTNADADVMIEFYAPWYVYVYNYNSL
jgi:hypothetical protein